MGKNLHKHMIVRIANPAIGDGIEMFSAVFCVRPQPALQCIRLSTTISDFANITASIIIKTINRVLAALALFLED